MNKLRDLPAYDGHVLILGVNAGIGESCVSVFKENNWWVGCIDLWKIFPYEYDVRKRRSTISITYPFNKYRSENINEQADVNILVDPSKELDQRESEIKMELDDALRGCKLDAIICTATDFTNGNVKEELSIKVDKMWKQNVWPSILSASIAAEYMKEGGMLCLSGAKAALEATPDMIAYGLSKAAVHQLTKSLATEGSELPANSMCIALLPFNVDNVINKESQSPSEYDVSSWTSTKYISDLLLKWSNGYERPENGSLVQFVTKNFITDVQFL